MSHLRRREFVGLLGGAAAAWPLAARAQQREKMRRIGVLMPLSADDPEGQARLAALAQGPQQLGWTIGHNLRIEYRGAAGNPDDIRKQASELIALSPEVIVANGSGAVVPLLQVSRTVPIVFAIVPDPVGSGFVDSLARPGGNATGFTLFEYGMSAKWLELLKEIQPDITRAAVLWDPALSVGIGQWRVIEAAARSLRVDLTPINIGEPRALEQAVATFARSPQGGLILTASAWAIVRRDLIISLAAQHRLPAVYFGRHFATSGGLIAYGPDFVDQYRQAAGYVDRILKGEKPADLPVQQPTKFELVINLRAAEKLGLNIPPTLLARADEVIE